MNPNETRTFWISIGAAVFAVFLIYSYTQERSAQILKKFGAKQRVVVAAEDINEMQTIDETMLQTVERPTDFIEPQAVNDPEVAVGQIALAPIKKDEQILQTKIIKPGPETGLSLQVAPSKRAVTIPVDETRGVARLISPGDRIDLVAALDVGKGMQTHREVKTIMQDVTVLATGLRVVNDLPVMYEKIGQQDWVKLLRSKEPNFNSITIEADPEEAQDLIYILSTSPGSLFITLRHPSDHTKKKMPEASIDTVLKKISPEMMNMQQRLPASPPPMPMPPPKKPAKKGPFYDK
jgi:pilus assembly protein CpaB